MAVKLRLRRMGKKKQPIYKIVAADARSPRDGRFLEAVGLYNPLTEPHSVDIKEERVLYWLKNGAQPTKTVKSLLRQHGITLKNELTKRGVAEDKIESELSEWKKMKEASAADKGKTKKKVSRKAKAKAETPEEKAVAPEEKAEEITEKPSEESSKPKKETISDESAAEVKGATSDEKEIEKE
ncbi:MAG: 30S ribosomal protein S16 [Ignavibacterium sp.]|nr:MAG: 30S ribosomal protein S16 [Ignavibacterium sp.]